MKHNTTRASFARRIAALFYDALLLVALFFVLTAIALALNAGEQVLRAGLRFLLFLATYAFYMWFWLHGGQTLGMRAWRLRLVDAQGQAPTWKAVNVRFLVAIVSWMACAMGYFWVLIDPQRRAWHDRASQTFVIYDTSLSGNDSNDPPQQENGHHGERQRG